MSTTPGPLVQLDRYRSLNRAPAWAPWLGDAPVVLAALFGVAGASTLAAHALRSLHDTHDGLGVVALVFAAGWLGMRIGLGVPARRARVVFPGWLKVLPIPASTLLWHWRRTSVRHAGIVGVVAALACCATAGLAGMGAVAALLATGVLAATLVGALAMALRSPPRQGTLQPHSAPRASTRDWMSPFDSSRMPHAGTWQLQRHWSRAGVVLSVAASVALLVFASAWGQAQATALPVLAAGLLLAIFVFNRSLDCTLLCSPAVRLLPLSGLQKVSALVRLPAQASLLALLAAGVLACANAPDSVHAALLVQMVTVTLAAWLLLLLLRVAACVSHPAGGIGVEIRYVAQLVACAMLLQALELVGIAAAFVAAGFWLRHGVARLP